MRQETRLDRRQIDAALALCRCCLPLRPASGCICIFRSLAGPPLASDTAQRKHNPRARKGHRKCPKLAGRRHAGLFTQKEASGHQHLVRRRGQLQNQTQNSQIATKPPRSKQVANEEKTVPSGFPSPMVRTHCRRLPEGKWRAFGEAPLCLDFSWHAPSWRRTRRRQGWIASVSGRQPAAQPSLRSNSAAEEPDGGRGAHQEREPRQWRLVAHIRRHPLPGRGRESGHGAEGLTFSRASGCRAVARSGLQRIL